MGSSAKDYYEMLEEYGSIENYKEQTGDYQREYELVQKRVVEMKKDFEDMSFKEFASKYSIREGYWEFGQETRDYVEGKITGPEYFRARDYHRRRR